MVTGSPSAGGPRRGEVVGERYEVRGRLRDEPFTTDYEALDQETEKTVLLRIVQPDLVPDDAARRSLTVELQETAGVGGRFLPGLLDTDREGARVFVVEPLPAGACLRKVLDTRAAEGRTLEPRELLPVVARLAAALEAIPPPWSHGDVRAEHVWMDPEHLQLVGPFLVPSLPAGPFVELLERDESLRNRLAPEIAKGATSDAADRWGVAAIAWEALTGLPPHHSPRPHGPVGDALSPLLAPDPARRPASLTPLVEALAEQAGLPVPELDPGAFRRTRRLAVQRDRKDTVPFQPAATGDDPTAPGEAPDTDRTRKEQAPVAPPPRDRKATRRVVPDESDETQPRARRVPGAAQDGTMEISADQVLGSEPAERAAQTKPAEPSGELDPRLVRAALGVAIESASSDEMSLEEAEEVEPAPGAAPPAPGAKPRPGNPTMELTVDDLEMVESSLQRAGQPKASARAQGPGTPPPSQQHAPEVELELPEGVKPVPRARVDSQPPPAGATPPSSLYDDSSAEPAAASTPPTTAGVALPASPAQPSAQAAAPGAAAPGGAAPAPARAAAPAAARRRQRAPAATVEMRRGSRSRSGLWIVLGAVVLAAVILGVSLLVASWRREQSDQQREERLRERFEQIQRQGQ